MRPYGDAAALHVEHALASPKGWSVRLLPTPRLRPNHGQSDLRLTPEGGRRKVLPKGGLKSKIPASATAVQEAEARARIARPDELRKHEGAEIVDLTEEVMGQNISYQVLSDGSWTGSRHSTRVLK